MARALITCLLLGLTFPAWAANQYVRPGATGANNGTDWTNAFTSIPAALTRGDTYYLADGSYGSYTMDDAVSGTLVITLKKATASDHGTETGWDSSYGDGTAAFTALNISTNYNTIDGNSALGAYGITVSYTGSQGMNITNGASNLEIRGVHIDGGGPNLGRGLRFYLGGNTVLVRNVRTSNIGEDCILLHTYQGVTIEYLTCHQRNSQSGAHGDAFELTASPPAGGTKNIVRYSYFDWAGQNIFFGGVSPGVHGDWDIYGNRFLNSVNPGNPPVSQKGILKHNQATVGILTIYNNTFDGIYQAHSLNSGFSASGVVKNNIYYALKSGVGGFSSLTHNYNYFDSAIADQGEANDQYGGDPFVSRSTQDFHLVAATTAGETLASPYNTDPDAVTRGADGTWDRGAYDFVSANVGAVQTFTLVNADTSAAISGYDPLSASQEVDTSTLPTNVAIRANTSGTLASVNFTLTGHASSCDSSSPYWIVYDKSTGTKTVTGQAYSAASCGGSVGTQVSLTFVGTTPPTPPPPQANVASVTLINSSTDQVVPSHDPIAASASINVSVVGTTLNLRANLGAGNLGSVRFDLDGVINYRCENEAPYSLAGDTSGDYASWTLSLASHTVDATTFANPNCSGTAGTTFSRTFTLTESGGGTQDQPPLTAVTDRPAVTDRLAVPNCPGTGCPAVP